MSKGNDSRVGREGKNNDGRSDRSVSTPRSSKSSVAMTAERARAIQAAADRTGREQDFKARAMATAARHEADAPKGEKENPE